MLCRRQSVYTCVLEILPSSSSVTPHCVLFLHELTSFSFLFFWLCLFIYLLRSCFPILAWLKFMAPLSHPEKDHSVFTVTYSLVTQTYATWRPDTWSFPFDSLMKSNYVLWKVLSSVYFSMGKKTVIIWEARHGTLIYLDLSMV